MIPELHSFPASPRTPSFLIQPPFTSMPASSIHPPCSASCYRPLCPLPTIWHKLVPEQHGALLLATTEALLLVINLPRTTRLVLTGVHDKCQTIRQMDIQALERCWRSNKAHLWGHFQYRYSVSGIGIDKPLVSSIGYHCYWLTLIQFI